MVSGQWSFRQWTSNILHNKWVSKTKTDANENVERYKARLVAFGNEQIFKLDYTLTFAVVMKLGFVAVILVSRVGGMSRHAMEMIRTHTYRCTRKKTWTST